MNHDKLHQDLTEAFIVYQHRLDNPFPSSPMSDLDAGSATYSSWAMAEQEPRSLYMGDQIFRAKVQSMVAGVIRIVEGAENERS